MPADGRPTAEGADAGGASDAKPASSRGEAGPPVALPAPSDPAPSAACGKGPVPGPTGLQTLKVNGTDRTFYVVPPATYDGKRPWPVLFGWHGAYGKANSNLFNLTKQLGDQAVMVYPNALVDPKAGHTTWMRNTKDDVAFFDATLAWLKESVCIDTTRIFSTGHSSGGFWSNTLGCQRGNVVRGIAPVSGGPRDMKSCVGNVAAWVAHGNKDDSLPEGQQARDFWLKRNGCANTSRPTTPAPCVAYDGCMATFPVVWCEFDGGHEYPSWIAKGFWSLFSRL